MAKNQKQVKEITSMEENFTQWYTDICLKAEMVDYASVKGFMIMRPYGYAIWERTWWTSWTACSKRPAMRTWPCPC